ncbi:ABC transporter ATP-binding protein [Luteolibacter yonseiensis]|uniref:ABC transporter ATP-binding protein n=1 Tax=Luteolibacter yonseiensis TaxID=1144680 RepID=A0A934VDS7_9BACT|nr:ABC transporter ATP-binding protein [Luteolibacter yonseiensis]MBK1818346.1 ABC transporter ATP-binding protein [Luteolibacter yonseiensis]
MPDSPPPSDNIVIDVRHVEKSFGDGSNRIHVLKRVDFQAQTGEITMLVGPSGCGKTTLLSAIAGTMRVDSGEIRVFGHSLEKMSGPALTRFRAQKIGFIFQQFNLIPTLTVAENVGVPLLIQGLSNGKALKRSRDILEKVGLGDRWKERPNKLSGGQQQRVAIARALVHEPPLVICDEPTAALDAQNGEIVMDLFRQVARSADRSVIIVTHDNRIFSYADRIARMDDGEIVEVKEQDTGGQPHFEHPVHV